MWALVTTLKYPLTKEQNAIVEKLRLRGIVSYPFSVIERNILSDQQRVICSLRYNNVSYEDIITLFSLPGPATLVSVIKLTARGFHWSQGEMKGGSYKKLPDTFYDSLKADVNRRTFGLNCMKTSEAKQIIYDAVEENNMRAIQKLHQWHSDKLVDQFFSEINAWECSSQYLSEICEKIGIWISTPESLEQARRKNCNETTVNNFYANFSILLQGVDKKYVYNADETGLTAKKAFRVLTTRHDIRITPKDKEMQHISVMCCCSAAGDKVPPFFILPKRESDFQELKDLFSLFYGTSTNGWMTSKLFGVWCIVFVAHIQSLRENKFLDPQKKVFLFLDGHPSRFAPFGMRFLKRYNICCIIFPAHCSHVMQPFDVGVASPLKSRYEEKFIKFIVEFKKKNEREPDAAETRRIRIRAFMEVWSSLSIGLIEKAFYSAGIVPFSKENLAMKNLITDPQVANEIYVGRRQNNSALNGKEATSDEIINTLEPYYTFGIFHNNPQHRIVLDFAQIYGADIHSEWTTGNSSCGKIFSAIPAIFENGINIMKNYQ